MEKNMLNFGVVGSGERGSMIHDALNITGGGRVHAVCDIDPQRAQISKERCGASEAYTDYHQMLARSDLDAVSIATPMYLHAQQSIAALKRDLHVLCEVTAGVSVQECRELVRAAKHSKGLYMMSENYCFTRENLIVREMAHQGMLGELYYAEAEYLHELKELNEQTPWRRRWQTGINGITYGTHSLGPVLSWMPGQRVVAVSCCGSGNHYRDKRGELYENEDSCVMLCKTNSGGLVKIRVDMLSGRPHAMTNYSVQGTRGAYESARAGTETNRIWRENPDNQCSDWENLESYQHFVPESARRLETQAQRFGHGGSDLLAVDHFLRAIDSKEPLRCGVHEALDMVLSGLVSQQSIAQGSVWLAVENSREWQ